MSDGKSVPERVAYAAGSVKVLVEAGVVRPMRPDRLWGVLRTLQRWGRSPAAGTISLAARHPDEAMIVDELGTLTYAEVHERTNALAHALSDAGIVEGDGVGIMCRNHRGFIESTVAVSKLGADALYLNTAFAGPAAGRGGGPREATGARSTTRSSRACSRRPASAASASWPGTTRDRANDPTLDELIAGGDPDDVVPPEREGRAVILTSGTTGTPKGASRGNPQSLDPAVARCCRRSRCATRQVNHIAAPLFHSWGFAHFTLGLILGTTFVLRRKFEPEACLAEVARYRCDALAVVPVMMQRIMELPEDARAEVRRWRRCGSSPRAARRCPATSRRTGWTPSATTLYNLYGSTEVAWASIATPPDMRAAPGTAGRPPRGTVVKLFDERGPRGRRRARPVGSSSATRCSSRATRAAARKDVIGDLMATGDVGRFDDGGRLFVEGRDDEMIVSGGENVFPKEVEDTLARHDGGVRGRGDRGRGHGVRPAAARVRGARGRQARPARTSSRRT